MEISQGALTVTTETTYEHVVLDDEQVPLIEGTSVKVVELVADHKAYGWSPEELHFQHPHLTLGQIHSALAYYWDHRQDLDEDIKKRLRRADRLRTQAMPSPLQSRLHKPS